MALTRANRRLTLTFAFNYGGRAEIIDAVRAMMNDGVKADDVSEKVLRRHLYEPDMPDPDLVIRTSGEFRISNFLLWELAYSELVFTPVLWPDFRKDDLARRSASTRSATADSEVSSHERQLAGVMSLYRDTGVVLRTYKLGEADRIVVLMTAGHGKVRAVAKGVRKTKSRFGGRLEPLNHVSLLLYEGRELDIVSQVETIDSLGPLLDDLDRLTQGLALLEAVDQLAQERDPAPHLYRMLVGALRTLEGRPSPLVVPAFYWKLLAAEGLRPELDACTRCGETEGIVAFDMHEGGVLCRACRRGTAISPEALRLTRMILGGEMNDALARTTVERDLRGRPPRDRRPRAACWSVACAPSPCSNTTDPHPHPHPRPPPTLPTGPAPAPRRPCVKAAFVRGVAHRAPVRANA